MRSAWLGLGGNIGDVEAALAKALSGIDADPECRVTAVSALWRTPPWGITDQPDFLNCCAAVETALDPEGLLRLCQRMEREGARTRGVRYGPRTIDVDIVAFEGVKAADPELILPHPRAAERAFVTVPMAQIAPDLMLGETTVADLAARADRAGMERLERREGWWRTG